MSYFKVQHVDLIINILLIILNRLGQSSLKKAVQRAGSFRLPGWVPLSVPSPGEYQDISHFFAH